MKTHSTIACFILLLVSFHSKSQKMIFSPNYTTSNFGDIVKITKVIITDSTTQIDFLLQYEANMILPIASNGCYIKDSNSEEKLMLRKFYGDVMNSIVKMNEDGNASFTMVFPAIDTTSKSLDIYSPLWNIYGVQLVSDNSEEAELFSQLKGNWLASDGSNQWVIGIYPKVIIYDGKAWPDYELKKVKDYHTLTLKDKNHKIEKLYMKLKWDDLRVGKNLDDMQLLRKKKERKYKNYYPDEPFSDSVFCADTAFYHGYIDGYHPEMGKTGMVYVNNVITGDQKSTLVTIDENGVFNAKVAMDYPQEVLISMNKLSGTIFLEPGQSLFHYINVAEFTYPYKSQYHYRTRERKSLYMGGECANISTDLDKMAYIDFFNEQGLNNTILDMTADDYKNYCLKFAKNEHEAFASFAERESINAKALQIMKYKIDFRAWSKVLDYENRKTHIFRKRNKIPFDQRSLDLEFKNAGSYYYSFYNGALVNEPTAVVAGQDYSSLVNRTLFAPVVRGNPIVFFEALKDSIINRNLPMTEEEERLLDNLIACKTFDDFKRVEYNNREILNSIIQFNKYICGNINQHLNTNYKYDQLKMNFGIDEGFFYDLSHAQEFFQNLNSNHMPMAEVALNNTKSKISNPYLRSYITSANEKLGLENEKIKEQNLIKTGYALNENPESEGEKIFDEIIQKYEGKVVLVDFWATWCGPCRSDMKRLKPLKKEFEDKDVVFLYLTNETSPLDTYELLAPGIPGEHFRLSPDEWNHIAARFQVSGIPHYTLVNKQGEVVKNGFRISQNPDALKELFNPYLE